MKHVEHVLFAVLVGCAATGPGTPSPHTTPPAAAPAASATDRRIEALAPVAIGAGDSALGQAIESQLERSRTRRTYIMTDKPLYQPGETIWFRADIRATRTLLGGPPLGLTMQLVSPRGAIVATRRVLAQDGVARNDFPLAAELDGGEYTLKLLGDDGTQDARTLVVNTYEAPRLQKTVELLRKAYGEGDPVAAAIEIKRATGEPFGERALTGVVTLDDAELVRASIRTDRDGKAVLRFQLPARIERGDGLVTIMADDGGVTESIQKRIPIVMKTLQLGLFPEGGELVDTLPGRVYFMARTTLGKPADIEGKVVDDRGVAVAELSSIHDGMGKFELQPQTDRRYHVEITRPAGITARFAVPAAKPGGCVVRSADQRTAGTLRIAAICSTARRLSVEAMLRERRLAGGAFDVEAGVPALVELPVDAAVHGVVRVTLFSQQRQPLAERLVFHGRGAGLTITMTADRASYSPRDPVKLRVRTTDASGRPVKASVGIAVVDETVLAFADDKSAGVVARTLLEPELGASASEPIEDPDFYFGSKPEAIAALDALLATRGYRRFEWRQVVPAPEVQP